MSPTILRDQSRTSQCRRGGSARGSRAERPFTIIDAERAVASRPGGRRARAARPAAVKDGLGWEMHDGLLCSDAMCIPLPTRLRWSRRRDRLDALARALDRPLAVDATSARPTWASPPRERGAGAGLARRRPTSRCPTSTGACTRCASTAAGRSSSSPGPRGEGAVSTCRSGRRCTRSCKGRGFTVITVALDKKRRRRAPVDRGGAARRTPRWSTRGTRWPISTTWSTCRPSSGSTSAAASCAPTTWPSAPTPSSTSPASRRRGTSARCGRGCAARRRR